MKAKVKSSSEETSGKETLSNDSIHLRPLALDEVIALWTDVQSKYDSKSLKTSSSAKVKVRKKKVRQTQLYLSAKKSANAARRMSGVSPIINYDTSTLDEEPDLDHLNRRRQSLVKSYPPYPLDFDYFENEIRSDDESKFQIEWRRSRESKSFKHQKCEPVDESVRIPYTIPEEEKHIREAQFAQIVLGLLTRICHVDVSRRRLRSSFDLSLSLATFASDSLRRFNQTKAGLNENISSNERYQLELALVKLLLTSLTELQFNANYSATLSQNQVLELCLWTLEHSLQRCEDSSASLEDKKLALKNTLQIGAALLHVIQSFHTFSQRFFSSQVIKNKVGASSTSNSTSSSSSPSSPSSPMKNKSPISEQLSLYNDFSLYNGPNLVGKIVQITAKQVSSSLFPEGILFMRELNLFLALVRTESTLKKKSWCSLTTLYLTMTKTISSLVQLLTKKPKAENLEFLREVLAQLRVSSGSSLVQVFQCWDNLLAGVQASTCANRSLVQSLLELIEEMVLRHVKWMEEDHQHNPPSSSSKDRPARVDQPAFATSDSSNDKKTNPDANSPIKSGTASSSSLIQDKMSFLDTYLDILKTEDAIIGDQIVSHLGHLIKCVPLEQKLRIIAKVIVPYLEVSIGSCSMELISSMNEVEVGVANKCLLILSDAIQFEPIMDYLYQQRAHITVLACNANFHLMGSAYDILGQYLLYQGRKLYGTLNSCHTLLQMEKDNESYSSDEHNLTDEEVFQPGLAKAVGFFSDMRNFHHIITACSAKVLEKRESTGERPANAKPVKNPHFKELAHVWHIQANLIDSFVAYQDYVLMRGLVRTLEDLLQCILSLMLVPKLEDQRDHLIASLGSFFRILVRLCIRLKVNALTNQPIPSNTKGPIPAPLNASNSSTCQHTNNGPSTFNEVHQILNEGLHYMSLVMLEVKSGDSRRKLISALLSAATYQCLDGTCIAHPKTHQPNIPQPWDWYRDASAEGAFSSSQYDADDELEHEKRRETGLPVEIIWPEMIVFMIELCSQMIEEDPILSAPVVTYTLFKFGRLTNGPVKNRVLLKEHNFILKLLHHQESFLGDRVSPELQTETMTLLTFFARQGLSREEFRTIINTFKRGSTVEPFLTCFKDICLNTGNPYKERCSLKFPINGLPSSDSKRNSSQSPVASFAINAIGPALKNGCTFSFWIKLPPSFKTKETSTLDPDFIEIFAFGGLDLKFCLAVYGSHVVRIEAKSKDASLGVATFGMTKKTIPGWNHMAFAFSLKSFKQMDISAFINGQAQKSLVIAIKSSSSCNFHEQPDLALTIGQMTSSSTSTGSANPVELSSLALLNINVINDVTAAFLLLVGPNVSVLTLPKSERPMLLIRHTLSHFPCLSSKLVDLNWTVMADEVSKRLIFTFNPLQPSEAVIFPTKQEEKYSFLSSLYGKQEPQMSDVPSSPVKIKSQQELSDALESEILTRNWQFSDVILEEGGTITLTLIVARLVELKAKENCIALALDVLLTVVNSSVECMSDFLHHGGRQLLTRILEESQDLLGIKSVAVILNHACTTKILNVKSSGQVTVLKGSNPILCHHFLIDILISQWKLLKKRIEPEKPDSMSILEFILHAFLALVSESQTSPMEQSDDLVSTSSLIPELSGHLNVQETKNPWSGFNVEVLRQFNIVETIMRKIHEDLSFGSSEEESHSIRVADLLIKMYAAILGSPMQLKILSSMMNNVILLHDPNSTFVSHSKSGLLFSILGTSMTSEKTSRASSVTLASSNCSNTPTSEDERGVEASTPLSCDSIAQTSPQNGQEVNESSMLNAFLTSNSEQTSSSPHLSPLEHSGPWGEESLSLEISPADQTRPKNLRDALIEGLLQELLLGFRTIDDRHMKKVLADTFLPEYFLVLMNNPIVSIRVLCVKILSLYLKKSAWFEDFQPTWTKIHGYDLVAFQLQKFEPNDRLVDAYLTMVHRSMSFRLEDQVELANRDISHISPEILRPAMVLLPQTVTNIPLAHGFILHLHEVFSRSRELLIAHQQLGLFLSIGKSLVNLAHSGQKKSDIYDQDTRDIVYNDLQDFLRLIVLRFVGFHGKENFTVIEDLLQNLAFLCRDEYLVHGPGSVGTKAIRTAFCVVVEESISELETKLQQFGRRSHSPGRNRGIGSNNLYGAFQPWEEMTYMLMRTMRTAASTTLSDSSLDLTRAANEQNNEHGKPATQSELSNRRHRIIDHTVEFVLAIEPKGDGSLDYAPMESDFLSSLLGLLIGEIKSITENGKSFNSSSPKRELQTPCRLFLRLLNFMVSPRFPIHSRMKAIKIVASNLVRKETLEWIFQVIPPLTQVLGVFMQDIKIHHDSELDDDEKLAFHPLYLVFDRLGLFKIRQGTDDLSGAIKYELDQIYFQESRTRQFYYEGNHECLQLVKKNFAKRTEKTNQSAIQVTKAVTKMQDQARKTVISQMKADMAQTIKNRQICERIIDRYTHEKAIWHFKEKHPQSWCLSEVEGSQRMRIRLERKFSNIDAKFYLEEHRSKAKRDSEGQGDLQLSPFGFLTRYMSDMSSILVENLNSDDHIRFMEKVVLVVPEEEIHGEILLSQSHLYFVERGPESESSANQKELQRLRSFSWNVDRLREIHLRWYQLNDNAVELFFASNRTRFFVFGNKKTRFQFIRCVQECLPKLSDLPDPEQIMKLWQDGTITNFDYLMQLNKLAGRTFNDLMQYPVYPFILSDYTSESLDLTNPAIYRDLRKPISIQNPEKQARFENNYEATKGTQLGPYHYGSHYSNSGIVLHFLIRVPPFTSMFMKYQDGHFDIPDRSFHDLRNTWNLASSDSSTDVKELIPDLFTLPELLSNLEGFDMGQKQTGERVHHVVLPPWAKNDPRLFIKLHRQALESKIVRESISHWIDLVFGYKQRGKAAMESINVFYPATYYGFDLDSIKDPVERIARATMIKTYGQTPKQLFEQPHPLTTIEWSKRNQINNNNLATRTVPQVMDHIKGVRWGSYVGSPSQSPPKIESRSLKNGVVSKLVISNSNEVT